MRQTQRAKRAMRCTPPHEYHADIYCMGQHTVIGHELLMIFTIKMPRQPHATTANRPRRWYIAFSGHTLRIVKI